MQKRNLVVAISVLLCISSFVSGCRTEGNSVHNTETNNTEITITESDIPDENKVSALAEYATYNYEGLKDKAVSIVKVEVLDELSLENSMVDCNEESGFPMRFCAVRKAEVLEVYKGDEELKPGDTISVQENTAIYEYNGEYYQTSIDDVQSLQKGGRYILFLNSGKNMSGNPGIVGCKDGTIQLDELPQKDESYDIAVKAIVEYESDLSKAEKDVILNADDIYSITASKAEETEQIEIEAGEESISLELGIRQGREGTVGISMKRKK